MRTAHRVAILAASLLGCGDNLPASPGTDEPFVCPEQAVDPVTICHDVSTPIAASGEYTRAADFDLAGCDPASLEGVDLAGVYDADRSEFSLTECADGFRVSGLGSGRFGFAAEVHQSESGLLIRSDNGLFIEALLVCGAGANDTLIAKYAFCSKSLGCSELSEADLVITPYQLERPNGEADAVGLRLVAEHAVDSCGHSWHRANYVSHVEYADNIAYVTVEESGLHLIDVSNPAEPKTVGSVYATDAFYNDIALFDIGPRRYAAIAGAAYTPIIDVTSPSEPFVVTRIDSASHRLDVQQNDDGTFLYTAANNVDVYELSDPAAPVFVGAVSQPDHWNLHATTIEGDKLYVSAGGTGFVVMDDPRGNPSEPVIHGIYTEAEYQYSHHAEIFTVDGTTYALHNDEIGTEPWFKIIDVTPGSPSFLQVQSEYRTTADGTSHNVTIVGTTAYLAYYTHGVRVLDISDPQAPLETAHFHTFEPASAAAFGLVGAVDIAVDPQRSLLFVADSRGLVILEHTD